MALFTPEQQDRIAAAVKAAEANTSGEIFTVIARASDDYRFIPVLWAALAALLVPMPLIFATSLSVQVIYLAQLAVFCTLAIVLSLPAVRPYAVPGPVQQRRAHRNAIEQFLAHGLHTTRDRTGVLIFVSLAERYAEVVADEAINEKVDPAVWDEAVAALIDEIRAGRPTEGFIAAIGLCGAALAAHFPPRPDDDNELSDRIVEI
ncbi:MAG: hypothetical protein R3D02_06375 [Hyphomicrobiales bacterium]